MASAACVDVAAQRAADSFDLACAALGESLGRTEAALARQREAIARMGQAVAKLLPLARLWVQSAA
jgi:hypothetical protein